MVRRRGSDKIRILPTSGPVPWSQHRSAITISVGQRIESFTIRVDLPIVLVPCSRPVWVVHFGGSLRFVQKVLLGPIRTRPGIDELCQCQEAQGRDLQKLHIDQSTRYEGGRDEANRKLACKSTAALFVLYSSRPFSLVIDVNSLTEPDWTEGVAEAEDQLQRTARDA